MRNFYSRLSYSFGNEDWNTEHKALQIQPTDRILCVTASGDRPLNLMTKPCDELVAVDANPFQTALFDLKKTALTKLPYHEYLSFLGVRPCKKRVSTYKKIEPFLQPDSTSIFTHEQKAIKKGILFEGAVEKRLKIAAFTLKFCRGKKINRLFSFDSIEEQTEFVDKTFDTPLWRRAFQIALHPTITRLFLNDPGLLHHFDPSISVGDRLYNRMHTGLRRYLAKESILASLILKGKIPCEKHLPPYLSESGVETIKDQIPTLSLHSTDLISYLEQAPDNHFDCFSLSDVASYVGHHDFERMVQSIHRVAKPGARFCIRQLLSNHQIPDTLASSFKRDSSLERELEHEDRCFVYRFMVGTIKK